MSKTSQVLSPFLEETVPPAMTLRRSHSAIKRNLKTVIGAAPRNRAHERSVLSLPGPTTGRLNAGRFEPKSTS
jgi:hypothetical protein